MASQRFFLRPLLCIFMLLLLMPAATRAQRGWWGSSHFAKGQNVLTAGVGFGMDYGYTPAAPGQPWFVVALDHGAIETRIGTIGIGGIASYKSVRHTYAVTGHPTAGWTNLTAGVRTTLHIAAVSDRVSNLDAYGGLMLGARAWRYHNEYLDAMGGAYPATGIRPVSGMFAGLRYSFGKKLGVWVEGGWDVAVVKGGVALKF